MARGAALALVALVGVSACGGSSLPKIVKARSLPGSYVEAAGHSLYFDCEGKGRPAVVLVSGLGVDSSSWWTVQRAVARVTRVCLYDRAGLGFSASRPGGALGSGRRDARDELRELEALLRNARIDRPVVLVGHSWGGPLVRLYAGTHRHDVAAVVLVDSSSPDQSRAFEAAIPPKRPGELPGLDQFRHADALASENEEHLDWGKSMREVATVATLHDLPLVVVTAGLDHFPLPADRYLEPVWRRLQRGLARLSSRSVHVIALQSNHFVQQGQPDVVAAAVRAAVAAARDGGRLPPCAHVFRMTGTRCVS
jgi:pimeloyl-ACP methyl ester carboxylesterase